MKKTALKRRTPLKRQSKKRKVEWPKYLRLRKQFLEHAPFCELPHCVAKSDDVHHMRGRRGSLLLNELYFLAVCRVHHDWIHAHPNKARLMGLLQ